MNREENENTKELKNNAWYNVDDSHLAANLNMLSAAMLSFKKVLNLFSNTLSFW